MSSQEAGHGIGIFPMSEFDLQEALKVAEEYENTPARECSMMVMVLAEEIRRLQRELATAIAANLCHVPIPLVRAG